MQANWEPRALRETHLPEEEWSGRGPERGPEIRSFCDDAVREAVAIADDHFTEKDGTVFAGTHVLLDVWGARHLDDPEYIERAMRRAAAASGATVLHVHLHRFGDGGGVTGVAVLAESHISVHTWPERGFAAFDVFMCGRCRPELAAETLRSALDPERAETSITRRGVVA